VWAKSGYGMPDPGGEENWPTRLHNKRVEKKAHKKQGGVKGNNHLKGQEQWMYRKTRGGSFQENHQPGQPPDSGSERNPRGAQKARKIA